MAGHFDHDQRFRTVGEHKQGADPFEHRPLLAFDGSSLAEDQFVRQHQLLHINFQVLITSFRSDEMNGKHVLL